MQQVKEVHEQAALHVHHPVPQVGLAVLEAVSIQWLVGAGQDSEVSLEQAHLLCQLVAEEAASMQVPEVYLDLVPPVAQRVLLVAEGVPAMLVTEQWYVVLAHQDEQAEVLAPAVLVAEGVPAMLVSEQRYVVLKAGQAEVLAMGVMEFLQGPCKHELSTYTHTHIQTYTNKHICKDTACKHTYSHRYCSSLRVFVCMRYLEQLAMAPW